MARSALQGSEREPLSGAIAAGKADAAERLEATVLLRRRNADIFRERMAALARHPGEGHLSRDDFARKFGADHTDIDAIRKFADWHGLSVVQVHVGRRTIVLSGTVAQFDAAFDVELQRFEYPDGSYRSHLGSIQIPDDLLGRIEAVLGLDTRPTARPRISTAADCHTEHPPDTSFTPVELAKHYDFPAGTGEGQCVGIVALGGGERRADLTAYFARLKLGSLPDIVTVSVDHAQNHPNGTDAEVMVDIEVVGAIVPRAKIVLYYAPNTDAGFLDAITTAIHDAANRPSVIAISWGAPELSWSRQSLHAFDAAFQAAAAMGITICVASDGGIVDFPASSPYALACGGTTLRASRDEIAWSGGSVSTVFAAPTWQEAASETRIPGASDNLTMRSVPDVSGNADPHTGYDVRMNGTDTVVGGTGAVASLWAALIARLNAAHRGTAGFITPTLYANPTALNDVTERNNKSPAPTPGWNTHIGLGTPNGNRIAAVLAARLPT